MFESLKKLAYRGREFLAAPVVQRLQGIERQVGQRPPDAAAQLLLQFTYQEMARSGAALPALRETGFKAYSQTDEDGILLFIFSIIGCADRRSIELCAGDGTECNTANLILNHGWHGLLVDGDERLVRRGTAFFAAHRHTYVYPPVFVHSWVTRDSVNDLLKRNGFEGEVDLLSLDMDGVDYWIWEALDCVSPRVVVLECQDILGPQRAWTVPYSDNFDAYSHSTTAGMPNYCGASLAAFVKLARRRGYRLVGTNRLGYNAFFVRNPLGLAEMPEVGIEECFRHPKVLQGMRERFPLVKDLPWVEA
jgi:hypothetical protein